MVRVMHTRLWLTCELLLLFVALPVVLWQLQLKGILFVLLWAGAGCCLVYLLLSKRFTRRRLWNARRAWAAMPRIVIRFLLLSALLTGVLYLVIPPVPMGEMPTTREGLRELGPYAWTWFGLMRWNPNLYGFIMILYPIFSVLPQNIIYRVFFFHRYRLLLGSGWRMVLVSAGAFGLGHLMFGNWVAPVLCAIGGVIMADTYRRTRSAAASWFEHSLFGDFVWTLGIGRLFYYNPG